MKLEEIRLYSAQISFYLLVSIIPFLMLSLTIIRYVAEGSLEIFSNFITVVFPEKIAGFFLTVFTGVEDVSPNFFSIIAFFLFLWSSIRASEQLIIGINKVNGIKDKNGLLRMKKKAFFLLLIIIFGMFGSFIFLVLKNSIIFVLAKNIDINYNVLQFFNYILNFFVIFFSTSLIFYFSLNKKQKFKDTFLGSFIFTLSWILLTFFFSLYSSFSYVVTVAGSLSVVFFLAMFIYFAVFIFLISSTVSAQNLFK